MFFLQFIYHLLIDFEPNGIPLAVSNQSENSKYNLIQQDSEVDLSRARQRTTLNIYIYIYIHIHIYTYALQVFIYL